MRAPVQCLFAAIALSGFALAALDASPRARADGGSPTITATGPGLTPLSAQFIVHIDLTGVPVLSSGYQASLVYDSSFVSATSVLDRSIQTGFWSSDFCPAPSLASTFGGSLPTPLLGVLGTCVATGAVAPARLGRLADVVFTSSSAGVTAIHMLSKGSPDSGGTLFGTLTIAGSVTTDPIYACGSGAAYPVGYCGPLPGFPITQTWDTIVDIRTPDLTVTDVPLSTFLIPGQPEEFKLLVKNSSPVATATNVQLSDELPVEFVGSLTSLAGSGASSCSIVGQLVTCGVASLAPAGTFSVTIRTVAGASSGNPKNCASATLTQADANPVDNSACVTVSIAPDGDGDGYSDAQEAALGKDAFAYCATMRADVDGDGAVSIVDLSIVAGQFLQSIPPAPDRYAQGPPPFDGQVTIIDLSKMADQFLRSVSVCP